VQIHLLAPVHARAPEDVREAARVVHAQDVDVVLAAESLNESEVNLESHIFHIIVVVSGQDAQHHVIGITEQKSWDFSYLVYTLKNSNIEKASKLTHWVTLQPRTPQL